MAIDHSPAWALIPWYGRDGMGAPTLADWRVWADWFMRYDPDDERDAAIARALLRAPYAAAVASLALAYSSIPARPSPLAVFPHFFRGADDGRLWVRIECGEFLGFEVQPTRREMRSWSFADVAIAADGLPADGNVAVGWIASRAMRPSKSGYIARAMMAMVERVRAEGRATVVRSLSPAPAATTEGDRWVNIPTPTNARQPRNPRRRGDTGAHGRARR